MHTQFRIAYDYIDSALAADVTPEQIDILLNNAQADLILDCKKKGFESTQTIRDYLANIKANANITPFFQTAANQPNGYFINLPNSPGNVYRTMVKEEVSVDYVDCNGEHPRTNKRIKVKPITEDIYNNIISDPFRKPNINTIDEFAVSMEFEKVNGSVTQEVITDGTFTPITYHIRYIRDPQRIQYGSQYFPATVDQDCELNDEAAREIIKRAVTLAKQYTQAPSYQINKESNLLQSID